MTPSDGVKVDGDVPPSTNARQLLARLLLKIGKVLSGCGLDLAKETWFFKYKYKPQMDNRRDLARQNWFVEVESRS